MIRFNPWLIVFHLLLAPSLLFAQQEDSVSHKGLAIELQGGFAGSKAVPFWMRSNQYGSVPVEGGSGSMILRGFRNYKHPGEWQGRRANGNSNWDWGYGLEGRVNLGKETQAQVIDAHVRVRFAMFEAKLGRSKDVMGLNGDTLLTSGNFAVSGNALGVPKFEISIPEYYRIPWFGGLFSIKGNFANGYMGKHPVDPSLFKKRPTDNQLHTLLHQKSLYGRIGKSTWKLALYGGLNHQAQWGSEEKVYGSLYDLNFLQTLAYVTIGKAYGGRGSGIPRSKIGNHQGSIDLGASYNLGSISLMAYRQNFYDVGALANLANIKDGLNGITLTNNNYRKTQKNVDWHKFLVEFFYSKDQAGYPWSKPTKSGDEDYYNNYYYTEGWSYKQVGLGNPLIVPSHAARAGQISYPRDYFISNRVVAGHIGVSFLVYNTTIISKITYAKHYGTFSTSEWGGSLGEIHRPPTSGIFTPVNQMSFLLQGEKFLYKNTKVGTKIAIDHGKLLDNGAGALVYIRRQF
ncbi:hypothetical protein E2P86_01135 [Sphingobacterium psychroaquaticum]|uniref:capsule assembly Wzi family protein n=1 Tax=Sphingobacterium psychroaquaticum TaxID=561061 RepID=UPI00106BEDA7|nr:capsule assembly Wzi family protein [Sphingobacterium psychroaquaticum]QBQ39830.1 hypothetical protein E2P86_01135 [Sphingobacterium psychroaquaticum]